MYAWEGDTELGYGIGRENVGEGACGSDYVQGWCLLNAEDETKEEIVSLHNEKLALAYGQLEYWRTWERFMDCVIGYRIKGIKVVKLVKELVKEVIS